MWTRLLNRPGPFEIQSSQTLGRTRRETAREKDGRRDENRALWAAAADAAPSGQRTTAHRKSMALFGMFRWRARTHGLRRSELLGRRNSYGQKFGSIRPRHRCTRWLTELLTARWPGSNESSRPSLRSAKFNRG